MAPRESEKLIAELKLWADEKYGRRSALARFFGVSPQLVTEWLAGRATPTWDDGLKIQAFLKKQRRGTRKS